QTSAACTVEPVPGGFGITTMKLEVVANVPGLDDAKFQEIAAATKEGCPVSKALKGNVNIELKATLNP
ncbi:MAG: OsmC family protein, partial [Gemmatimonadota bacterium]|nr:OsmC family protein [Gemmatimonadota bacterium]